jgi:hypothetical protein
MLGDLFVLVGYVPPRRQRQVFRADDVAAEQRHATENAVVIADQFEVVLVAAPVARVEAKNADLQLAEVVASFFISVLRYGDFKFLFPESGEILHSRSDHFLGLDPLVKVLSLNQAQCQGGFLEGSALGVSLLGDFRRVVVANVRIERSNQHQALLHQLVDAGGVRLDADDAMVSEGLDSLGQKLARVKKHGH